MLMASLLGIICDLAVSGLVVTVEVVSRCAFNMTGIYTTLSDTYLLIPSAWKVQAPYSTSSPRHKTQAKPAVASTVSLGKPIQIHGFAGMGSTLLGNGFARLRQRIDPFQ
jgi:hypothetical protein